MTKTPKKSVVKTGKPKQARQMPTPNPLSHSVYAALGFYKLPPHVPMTPTTAPSAEWLTEMLMGRIASPTKEDRDLWDMYDLDTDEIRLHEAAVILDHYRMALLAIDISTGKANGPLQLEEIFTEEQLENGVEYGSKQMPGWPEIVTGYDTRSLALRALKDWVDWERSSGPAWCRRVPQKTFKILGEDFEVADGEEWLKMSTALLDGWKDCREVYLMRRKFQQYEAGVKWEKEAKQQWEKRQKKVLGETSGKNSAEAGKKVAQPGKLARAKPAVRKRKKAD